MKILMEGDSKRGRSGKCMEKSGWGGGGGRWRRFSALLSRLHTVGNAFLKRYANVRMERVLFHLRRPVRHFYPTSTPCTRYICKMTLDCSCISSRRGHFMLMCPLPINVITRVLKVRVIAGQVLRGKPPSNF